MHDDLITLIDAPIVLIPLRARDGGVRAFAIVDAADADFVDQWRWRLNANGYASFQEGNSGIPGGRRYVRNV